MKSKLPSRLAGALAAALAVAGAGAAAAQDYQGYPPPPAPPPGEYAPPPEGAEPPGSVYGPRAQYYDRDYAQRYSQWAAQNCIDQRNNTVAGAAIGGVMGALLGAGVAGHHDQGAGAVVGGALGATAGAAIGHNAGADCPPGYYVRAGAPVFAYPGPAPYPYPPNVIYGPGWYTPWVWYGGQWVYRPYRYWYWGHRTYWGPYYRPGPYHYRYHRW
jgi:hypothetical protein